MEVRKLLMKDEEATQKKLLELLMNIDFDKKYFEYYDSHSEREQNKMSGAGNKDYKAALATTPLDFKYSSREKFFSHTEKESSCTFILNEAFRYSTAELIFYVETKQGSVGGPVPKLAREAGQLRDPNFSPSPTSPKLPFSNADELREVVQFGVSLFEDAKRVILS